MKKRFYNLVLCIYPFVVIMMVTGCGGGGGESSTAPSPSPDAAPNVLAISVNDPSSPNKPTVSVTVCTPGTSNCQTIDDILLDTGSFGLRIFKQASQNVSLPQVTAGSGSLAECVAYRDGSAIWGPVKTADVILGGETAPNVPIQIIDAAYFANAIPAACKLPNVVSLAQGPESKGFNGILGVGLFASDCGQACVSGVNNSIYYATCSGSICSGTAVPLASQVKNPVVLLEQDNNGVIVQLPAIPPGGALSVSGQLILGIDTRSNNAPSGVTSYPANSRGEFTTVFNGSTITSVIDSGSNGLFFNAPASILTVCSPPNQDWYCPQTTQSLSATIKGATGSPSGAVLFQIVNTLSINSKGAIAELGGPAQAGGGFDWGLPFFFGRQVFVGIDGKTSSLGKGPYWAF